MDWHGSCQHTAGAEAALLEDPLRGKLATKGYRAYMITLSLLKKQEM